MAKYLEHIDFNGEDLKLRDIEGRALIQDNTNEIASVKVKANMNEAKIDALTDRLDVAEDDIDALETRMTTAESDIDNLEVHMNAAESNIADNTSDITALTNRVTSVEGNLDSVLERVDTLEDIVPIVEGLQETVDQHTTELTSLDGRLDTAEDDIVAIKAKDRLQDDLIEELDRKIVASTYEAGEGIYFGQGTEHTNINVEDELLDEIHASTAKNVEQDGRLNSLEDRMDTAESDIDALETRMGVTESRLDSHDTALDLLDQRLDTAESDIDALETAVDGLDRRLDQAESDIDDLQNTTSSLGALAFKDSADGSYTPAGTISGTAVSVPGTTVQEITSVGTLPSKAADTYVAPSVSYDSATETLTFTPGSFTEGAFSAGTLPTRASKTVGASGAATVTDGTFTGTPATITVD